MAAGFEQGGFEPWRPFWLSLDAYADQPVVLVSGETRQAGIARGVDARGALQLETTLGLHTFYGGELSMRPAS